MKTFYSFFAALLMILSVNAQSPDKFNYQAVLRNSDGTVVSNQSVNIKLGIIQGSAAGTAKYIETHAVTTNSLGLANLIIGNGTPVSGSLANLDWSAGPFYLKIWVNEIEMGATQLLSVPFAKYAERAGNGFYGDYNKLINKPTGKKIGDILYWNDSTWAVLSSGQDGQVLTMHNGVPAWAGQGGLPSVVTLKVYDIESSSAVIDADATNDGGTFITQKGICYGKSPFPTINVDHVVAGANPGLYTAALSSLEQDSTYYIRAYATNYSGTAYGNQLSFVCSPRDTTKLISDIDGNQYDTLVIGTQTWLQQNLKVTKFNDGTPIFHPYDTSLWNSGVNPKYCWMNDDSVSYCDPYGAIYNWPAVNSGNLCPVGWHVPSDDEWTVLVNYLGGEAVAGGKLKEIGTSHWMNPNTAATNLYRFNAVPGGERVWEGMYGELVRSSFFWSSTEFDSLNAWDYSLTYNSSIIRENSLKDFGRSVRCIKN